MQMLKQKFYDTIQTEFCLLFISVWKQAHTNLLGMNLTTTICKIQMISFLVEKQQRHKFIKKNVKIKDEWFVKLQVVFVPQGGGAASNCVHQGVHSAAWTRQICINTTTPEVMRWYQNKSMLNSHSEEVVK